MLPEALFPAAVAAVPVATEVHVDPDVTAQDSPEGNCRSNCNVLTPGAPPAVKLTVRATVAPAAPVAVPTVTCCAQLRVGQTVPKNKTTARIRNK